MRDFSRAQQAGMALRGTHNAAGPLDTTRDRAAPDHHEFALLARRTANLPSADTGLGLTSLRLNASRSVNGAERIYTMLRDEVAVPALRRFERAHRQGPTGSTGHASRNATRTQATTGTPPWFDDLLPHLRMEAQILAQRGLDVDKVRHRLDTLFRHEHPGLSWRSMRIGLERDALPFAVGSTLLSVLADTLDPRRAQAMMWPPVEALGVVLVNLIGMARFTTAHPEHDSRLGRLTPVQPLESLNVALRNPVRDITGHVVGFVFCYGVLRNLARLAAEAGLSALLPGIMSHRFANTVHSALEILLAPLPRALLNPIIDRIAIAPEDARLELVLQDRFADHIFAIAGTGTGTDNGADNGADTALRPGFWHQFTGLLRSGAPRAIWLTLTLGFYFLSTLHDDSRCVDDGNGGNVDDLAPETALALMGNATASPFSAAADADSGVNWHTQAVLSVLYGLIATTVALQGIASRHEAIATAYTRRRGRPKISTITVGSQGDSGHSSAGSHSDVTDSPASPHFDTQGQHPESGDVSGDDSIFLPMADADDAGTSSGDDAGIRRPHTPPPFARYQPEPHQPRKRGTSVAPAGLPPQASPETLTATRAPSPIRTLSGDDGSRGGERREDSEETQTRL